MRLALRVEALKLRVTPGLLAALTGTLCVGAALAVVQAALASAEAGVAQGPPVLEAVRAGQLGALGLGVICGGGEYRHETLDTLLAAFPRRGTVLLAKTTVLTLSAVVLALAATALGTGIGAVVLHARGAAIGLSTGDLAGGAARMVGAYALLAVLGLAVSTVLRGPALALAVIIVGWVISNSLAAGLDPALARLLPSRADEGLTAPHMFQEGVPLSPALAGLVLGGYVAVLLGLAAWRFARRDVA